MASLLPVGRAPPDKIQISSSHAQAGLGVHSPEKPNIFSVPRLLITVTSACKGLSLLFAPIGWACLLVGRGQQLGAAPPGTSLYRMPRTSPLATPADTGTVLVHRELTVTGTIKFGIWEGSLSRGVAGH